MEFFVIYGKGSKMELNDYIRNAMERIETLYYETKGKMYLSFSGGKDSTVLLQLAKLCYEIGSIPELPKAVFSNTRTELMATVEFVKWCKESGWYENIEIIYPERTFAQVVKDEGYPMISKIKSQFLKTYQDTDDNDKQKKSRLLLLLFGKSKEESERATSKFQLASKHFNILHPNLGIKISDKCCYYLKKLPFEKYAIDNDIYGYADGEMVDEGGIRATSTQKRINGGGKICTKTKYISKLKRDLIVKMPIIDWTKEIEEEFIKKYQVPLSKAYNEYGCKRTGCVGCPYGGSPKDVSERLEILYKYEKPMYKYCMTVMKNVYIAQNIPLIFDKEYEKERGQMWEEKYDKERYEMIKKYRPEKEKKYRVKDVQIKLF